MRSNITSKTRMCRRSYDVLGISKTTMMYLESLFADLDFFQFLDDESLKYLYNKSSVCYCTVKIENEYPK